MGTLMQVLSKAAKDVMAQKEQDNPDRQAVQGMADKGATERMALAPDYEHQGKYSSAHQYPDQPMYPQPEHNGYSVTTLDGPTSDKTILDANRSDSDPYASLQPQSQEQASAQAAQELQKRMDAIQYQKNLQVLRSKSVAHN